MTEFVPFQPPVSYSMHSMLAVIFTILGFSLMAYFFAARSSTKSSSIANELLIAICSSVFMSIVLHNGGKQMKRRVLCYGDSLTAGWWLGGLRNTPYSHILNEENNIEAVSIGHPGWRCDGLVNDFEKTLAKDSDFEYCVLLGGTNDLADQRPPEEIFMDLNKMYDMAQSKSIEVVTVTVPPLSEPFSPLDGPRDALNTLIKTYSREKNMKTVDFHDEIAKPENRSNLYDDNVHMNENGYRLLGECVLKTIKMT